MIKKGLKFVSLALSFGILASVAFQGTNYIYYKSSTQEENAQLSSQAELNIAKATGMKSTVGDSANLDVSGIAQYAMPSLVSITNKSVQEMQSLFGLTQSFESQSSGTGIIIGQTDSELLIVTNNHVVNGAQTLSVGFVDGTVCQARIKGTDSAHDLAVIAVKISDISKDTMGQIRVIELGRSSDLQVGEQVIAIGNALGYGQSVTTGIVSALNRQVTIDNVTNTLIQTDAAINPGNSGGALLNRSGQLIGINSAKYSDTTVEGMGYAIPVDDVVDIIESLMNRTIREEKVAEEEQGFLGITGQDVTSDVANAYDMPKGIYITSVEAGSGADKAGLKKGDIITKFDGTSVYSLADLKEQLSYYKKGEKIDVTFSAVSDGEYTEQTVKLELGEVSVK
ncbi:MAG: trypsin-like serine protease [Lachnospiraceae bacterium]|nr:trypsin-like serine protease [Lachnospiraceae bacterium]